MAISSRDRPGCLSGILRLFSRRSKPAPLIIEKIPVPYHRREHFLSAAEISFYHVLTSVIGAQAVICPKVRLADVFFVAQSGDNFEYFRRISSKHVDFLICEPGTMRPILGIELDDKSHTNVERQERDEFVNKTFETAELPLLHFAAQMSYDPRELAKQVSQYLGETVSVQAATMPTGVVPPLCPNCGVPMVLRTAKQGKYQGEPFYGCPNYPNCKVVLPVK